MIDTFINYSVCIQQTNSTCTAEAINASYDALGIDYDNLTEEERLE